ncbi:hypothetical protein JCM15519_25870 [Fundidesulfovibrio butyratiphilus]
MKHLAIVFLTLFLLAAALGSASAGQGRLAALLEQGNKAEETSNFKRALKTFEKGLKLARQAGDRRAEGQFLNRLGVVREDLGQYDQALELHRRALDLFKAIGDRQGEAACLGNIGKIYRKQGRTDEALQLVRLALDIARQTGDLRGQAIQLRRVGTVLDDLRQNDEALKNYNLSLEISRRIGYRSGEGDALGDIAIVHKRRGRYREGLELYKQALAIDRELGDRSGESAVLNNIGVVYEDLGQYERALRYFRRALKIKRAIGNRRGEGIALGNVGDAYRLLGQYTLALRFLREALALRMEIGDVRGQGYTLSYIGNCYVKLEDYDAAREAYARSLDAFRRMGSVGLTARVLVKTGEMELAAGNIPAARSAYEQALPILTETREPLLFWRCLSGLSRIEAGTGNPGAGIYFGKRAVSVLQSLRRDIATLGQSLQKSFMKDKEAVYRRLADLLIDQGRLAEGQQVLGMLKEEEYLDFVRRDASGADVTFTPVSLNPGEQAAEIRQDKAAKGLAALGKEVADLEKKGSARTEAETARLKAGRAELNQAHGAFQQTLKEIVATFNAQGEDRKADLAAKQLDTDLRGMVRALGPEVALVHYLVLPDGLRILVTTPRVILARKVEVKQADLNRMVHEFRQALQKPSSNPAPAAKKLHACLVAPIEKDLAEAGTKILMVSLDGALRYIPVAALRDETSYLAERYAVAVFTEAARDKIKDEPAPEWKLAGFGVSKACGGFSALSGVPDELRSIVGDGKGGDGVMPGVARLDEEFTLNSFRDALVENYPALHIASHFKFEPGDNLSSFLLLGDGKPLSLSELRDGDYYLGGVDLLTLSACETAMGGNGEGGREVEGFGALVQKKGAKGVLATLWPVADQSTALFMRNFYRLHQDGHVSKAEALRQAQLAFIKGEASCAASTRRGQAVQTDAQRQTPTSAHAEPAGTYRHPFYWAPFILMGNWK